MKKNILLVLLLLIFPAPCFAAYVTAATSLGWVSPCSSLDGYPKTFAPSVYNSPGGTGSTSITVTGTGDAGFSKTFTISIPNSPVREYTFTLGSMSGGSCNIKAQYSNCPLPWDSSEPYYNSDGMTCMQDSYNHTICGLTPTTLPSAQPCCANYVKDGLEYVMDKGGACENLATVCAEGGEKITVGGVTFCGVPRSESSQGECEANGAFWASGACYFNAGAPVYEGPNPDDTGTNSTESLEAQNKTNQILKDMVNSNTRDASNIVSAINTNSDVSNQNGSKIVAAITENKSAIVAAINAKNFNPTINVAAPSVTVQPASVNIDTSSITNAVQANGAKLDSQTGIFNGISLTLDQHLATAQAARTEAAAASGQAIIRADATNGKLDQTNGKLDTANGELNGIKTTLDQHLAVATAARDAASDSKTLLTNIKDGQDSVKLAVDGVKAAIEANGPGGTGTATDMTATNSKLDEIKGLLGSGNPQASQPTAPAGFGERFTGLQDSIINRWDVMKDRVLASGAFGSLQQLLGAIPNGGGSTAISINAGRFGDISYDFGNLGQALAVLALIFKAIFSVLAIRIILLKGG